MVNFDAEADAMEAKMDEKYKEELSEFENISVPSQFPNLADQEVMKELQEAAKKIVDRNERITAFKAIGVKLSVEGLKMAKGLSKFAAEALV